jgi:hypothetical protein
MTWLAGSLKPEALRIGRDPVARYFSPPHRWLHCSNDYKLIRLYTHMNDLVVLLQDETRWI